MAKNRTMAAKNAKAKKIIGQQARDMAYNIMCQEYHYKDLSNLIKWKSRDAHKDYEETLCEKGVNRCQQTTYNRFAGIG